MAMIIGDSKTLCILGEIDNESWEKEAQIHLNRHKKFTYYHWARKL